MITRIEGIDLPLLTSIDLSCNEIRKLEGLASLASLEELAITKNMITDIDYLLLLKMGKLKHADFAFNRLSLGYLE